MNNDNSSNGISRRNFVNRAAFAGGAAVLATTAGSYSRILGANDRISLGHIGCGSRGRGLDFIISELKTKYNAEMTAVCDLWTVNRERAAGSAEKTYGRPPRAFKYFDELLALKDLDAVVVSTGDFQHAQVLKAVVEAGKDAYSEKPFANDLDEAKATRDAVKKSGRIVQIGTQHRSEPYQIAMKNEILAGALGQVTKYELEWNYHGPRWRGRPEVKMLKEQDTDWKKWLLSKPYRPFDPRAYFEFRLYKDFSGGITDQWMSHGIDLVHFFLEDHFPKSVMAHGGVFAWHDGRENPDTFQTLLEYPKGFLVSYSVSFGNDADSFSRIMGKKATAYNLGGEGSPFWKIVDERGNHEANPNVKRQERIVKLPGSDAMPPRSVPDEDTSHMTNFFECLRSRKTPNAHVDAGFSHAVAIIMATRAYREGKKLYWDAANEQIVDHPVA